VINGFTTFGTDRFCCLPRWPSSNFRGMTYWLMGELSAVPFAAACLGAARGIFLIAAAVIYMTASDLNLLLSGRKKEGHASRKWMFRRVRIRRVHRCVGG